MENFLDNYYLIQEKFHNYQYDLEHGSVESTDDEYDEDSRIFGIEIKHDWIHIGQAHIYTDGIAQLISIENDTTPLIDNRGNVKGELEYSILPKFVENGSEQNLVLVDNIDQLHGKSLKVLIKLIAAKNLPLELVNEVIVQYKWIDENAETFKTEVITSKSRNPSFNYKKEHELFISPYVQSHIWDGALAFEVLGKLASEKVEEIKTKRPSCTLSQNPKTPKPQIIS